MGYGPGQRGRPTRKERWKRLRARLKAVHMAQVVKETKKMNQTEAYRRYKPGLAETTYKYNAYRVMGGKDVMDELEGILRLRDKDLAKKISPEVIMQDIMDDLNVLNDLRDSGKISVEDMVKVLNAKGVKQKLLGMAIGAWKAEKPQEREKSASELMQELRKSNDLN